MSTKVVVLDSDDEDTGDQQSLGLSLTHPQKQQVHDSEIVNFNSNTRYLCNEGSKPESLPQSKPTSEKQDLAVRELQRNDDMARLSVSTRLRRSGLERSSSGIITTAGRNKAEVTIPHRSQSCLPKITEASLERLAQYTRYESGLPRRASSSRSSRDHNDDDSDAIQSPSSDATEVEPDIDDADVDGKGTSAANIPSTDRREDDKDELAHEEAIGHEETESHGEIAASTTARVITRVVLPKVTNPNLDNDLRDLSHHIVEHDEQCEEPTIASRKRKHGRIEDQDDELALDESMDVPIERYKPRPSRSRGGKSGAELSFPLDCSNQSERMDKITITEQPDLITSKNDTTTIIQDGITFAPRGEGHVKDPDKARTLDDTSEEQVQDVTGNTDLDVEVNRPPREVSRGRPGRRATSRMTMSQSNGSIPLEHEDMLSSTKEPRRPDNSLRLVDQKVVLAGSNDPSLQLPALEELDAKAPGSIPSISNERNDFESCGTSRSNDERASCKPTIPRPPDPVPSPSTPNKQARDITTPSPQKGPDKHSPLSRKISYRIGLSKRARIAPLLRIVRQ